MADVKYTSITEMVREYSKNIKNDRTEYDVFKHLCAESEEIRQELSTNTPGEDGVMGECIDVILCALDMIFLDNPNITEQEIINYAHKKCEKWKNKYNQTSPNQE